MAQHIQATVSIEGEVLTPFSNISIFQDIQTHHGFQVTFPMDAFEKTSFDVLQKSKSYIGKQLSVKFGVLIFEEKLPDNEFIGLITKVGVTRLGNGEKSIVITGHSPTILLDGLPQCRSFTKKNLKAICDAMQEKVPQTLSSTIDPQFSATIPYAVQYNESNFRFLQRMAARYGEWCFYNGKKFIFGKLNKEAAIDLPFGENLFDLEFSVKVLPVNHSGVTYLYAENKSYTASPKGSQSDLDDFGKFALDQSAKVFPQIPVYNPGESFENKKDLEDYLENMQINTSREFVVATGSSDNPYINTGSVINITGETVNEHDYGKLVVTAIHHNISGNFSYSNNFTAIPSENQTPPQSQYKSPDAHNQPAVITDNVDPEGLGRVKAKLFWQKDSETTPWIRVSNTMAGKANKVYGFYFIPEIGDEVMIGFEDNNNDKPFVIGSLYHKNDAPSEWKDSKNDIKVIRTKSGNQIYLIDKDGKEEIKILNKDVGSPTNIISLSMESNGKITIESKGDINLKAKNISMKASELISMESGKSTTMKAKDVSVTADTDIKMKAKDMDMSAQSGLKVKSQKATVESTTISIKASAKLEMEGAQAGLKSQALQIDGGAMATFKAGIVQIN